MTTKRIAFWAVILFSLLLLLVALLQFAGSWVINRGPLKDRIEAAVSRGVGGQLSYQRARLAIFPRLRIVIQQPSLSVPGRLSATR